ncbi:hypothetical protein HID58_066119 [Brassica napus]|uniref:BnaC05g21760D protein n=2 Tax=Brassica napus TaxID=3708 RepID=A0A078GWG0_BRANA|nr:hypothetical protein HID58_066119 [Brassica napus]CAF1928541.1 unnamed protein product [Brassica napus]CDY30800.1 BnaC05g21760D [Brassica napus]
MNLFFGQRSHSILQTLIFSISSEVFSVSLVALDFMETEIGNQETARSTSLICDPVMADSIDKMVIETCKVRDLCSDWWRFD